MSSIPPDIIGSAIQAGFAQREAARALEADRTGQSHAARTQIKAVDEAAASVETGDNDTQVFTDAEGSGSQGRSYEEAESGPDEADTRIGPPKAADGGVHLDIEA